MLRSRLSLVLLLTIAIAAQACGKKGDPQPPVPVIAKSVSDLVVTQRGPKVILTWSYPSLTTTGTRLKTISRITIYRFRETLPPSLAGRDPRTLLEGEVSSTVVPEIALFSKVPAVAPAQFTKLREKLDSIERVNLPGFTEGAKIVYEDEPMLRSEDGQPVRINYAVVTEVERQKSDLSNIVSIVPLAIAQAPAALIARPAPEAVVLTWQAPKKSITGADNPTIVGYNIYRAGAEATSPISGTSTPVNATPVTDTTYRDVPPYGVQQYTVTAVATVGPPVIESEPAMKATVGFKDLLPPPVPADFTTLSEVGAVRLVWDAVDATDLAGYNVYRTANGNRVLLTTKPTTDTNFRDASPVKGVPLVYSVTSVDTNGNESAEAKAAEIMIPQ